MYVDIDVSAEYLDEMYRLETPEVAAEAGGITDPTLLARGRIPEFVRHWKAMVQVRGPAPGDRLLDFGCQTGEFGSIAAGNDVIPCGVELSATYAQHCVERWPKASQVFDGLDSAVRDGWSYQYLSSFETLEHLIDPLATLMQLRKLMASDAVLAVSVPSSDYFHLKFRFVSSSVGRPFRWALARRRRFYGRQVLPHTHIYSFSPNALSKLMGRAGLTCIIVQPTGWHGRLAPAMRPVAALLYRVTGRRVCLAPSVFALARLA